MVTELDSTRALEPYLTHTTVIDGDHPEVRGLARRLRSEAADDVDLARRAFEWVRDEVAHSFDACDPRVTLRASDVLRERVGLCYAKSHLLAALLRAEGIPTALCYQRLAHGDAHVLHGLVAIHLDGSWHRHDPRGNTNGIAAQFSLGEEKLAWSVDPGAGEIDYEGLWSEPSPAVVAVLQNTTNVLELRESGLPTAP